MIFVHCPGLLAAVFHLCAFKSVFWDGVAHHIIFLFNARFYFQYLYIMLAHATYKARRSNVFQCAFNSWWQGQYFNLDCTAGT